MFRKLLAAVVLAGLLIPAVSAAPASASVTTERYHFNYGGDGFWMNVSYSGTDVTQAQIQVQTGQSCDAWSQSIDSPLQDFYAGPVEICQGTTWFEEVNYAPNYLAVPGYSTTFCWYQYNRFNICKTLTFFNIINPNVVQTLGQ